MQHMLSVPWGETFAPHTPILEIVVRGTITYLVLFVLLRIIPKREAGAAGITDLLVVVLIADAAQNAMANNYTSITDGLVLVGTIVFWAWALNWLGYRVPFVQRLLQPRTLVLVRDGRILRKNMQKELITEDELCSQIRLQGIKDLADVKEARVEPDGRISVMQRETKQQPLEKRKVG